MGLCRRPPADPAPPREDSGRRRAAPRPRTRRLYRRHRTCAAQRLSGDARLFRWRGAWEWRAMSLSPATRPAGSLLARVIGLLIAILLTPASAGLGLYEKPTQQVI